MQKRISALLLAMVIVIGSVLGGNTLKVKAASATVAMSPELAAEFYMVLLQVAETAMHVSGANNGFNNKEAMEAIGDGVQGYFVTSMSEGVDFEFQTTDGQTFKSYSNSGYPGGLVEYTTADGQIYKLSGDKFTTLLLNGTITLDPDIYNDTDDKPTVDKNDEYVKNMKAMFDAKWDELKEIGFDDGSGGDPTPSPSPDPKKVFTKIALVSLGTSLIAVAGAFVKDLFDGKVEGIDPDNYIDLGFAGSLDQDTTGNYIVKGQITKYYSNDYFQTYVFDTTYQRPVVAYIAFSNDSNTYDTLWFTIQWGSGVANPKFDCKVYYYDASGSLYSTSSSSTKEVSSSVAGRSLNYSLNIPVFDSMEHAKAYLQSGILTGLLNGEAYDFPDLATSTAERLQPLTGYEFAPGRLPGINAALSTAAAALPEPGLDPAENTEAYKNALNAALTSALPEPAPEPEPEPDPSPSPDPGTDGEGESYKRDLRLLFPFCIPFDFIHLIQALKAEPETPKFEIPVKLDFVDVDTSIVIDLAWMDPIMKIWRLGELGLFIVMLMKSTSKVIRW